MLTALSFVAAVHAAEPTSATAASPTPEGDSAPANPSVTTPAAPDATPSVVTHARPHATRYLLSSSGYTMGKGHGYLSQREFLLTDAAVGVTDRIDVSAGALLEPAGDSVHPTVGVKAAVFRADGVAVAVGARGGDLYALPGLTGYAVASFGRPAANVSVGVGTIVTFGVGTDVVLHPHATLAGVVGLGERWSLVSDNQIVWQDGPELMVGSVAARRAGRHLWFDAGILALTSASYATGGRHILPAFNVGWDFGTAE